ATAEDLADTIDALPADLAQRDREARPSYLSSCAALTKAVSAVMTPGRRTPITHEIIPDYAQRPAGIP
ncbi:MAG TPA: hypothetical protein VGD83_18430, partial [Streptosporangiaceae bacterium]